MQSVPFLSLQPQHDLIRRELELGFGKVIDTSHYILGDEVVAFEKEYAAYSGVKHCVAVANGMDALYISLKLLGIAEGDEVIVPALTCVPTWMAVTRSGATIVPVDVHLESYCMDERKLEQVITHKTKAIVPVNLYGRPANLPVIAKLGSAHGIAMVEDNAQGHGASILEKHTGSFGMVAATSFYPTKNLGALGDGGAITTNSDEVAESAKRFRNYGTTQRFHHDIIGINSRLDELQAAFLRIKLKHLNDWNKERQKIARRYQDSLERVGDLILPRSVEDYVQNYHLFVVRTNQRDAFRKYMSGREVMTDIHYPVPPHLQPAYHSLGFRKGNFPISEKICETILSLPMWPGMKEEQVDYVIECTRGFFV